MADEYSISKTDDGKLYLLKNGEVHEQVFRMKDALEMIGITAPTYYRWVNSKQITDVSFRDRANWRLFTESDIERIKSEANKVHIVTVTPAEDSEGEGGE